MCTPTIFAQWAIKWVGSLLRGGQAERCSRARTPHPEPRAGVTRTLLQAMTVPVLMSH